MMTNPNIESGSPSDANRIAELEDRCQRFATRLADSTRNANEALSMLARENARLREGIANAPWGEGMGVVADHFRDLLAPPKEAPDDPA